MSDPSRKLRRLRFDVRTLPVLLVCATLVQFGRPAEARANEPTADEIEKLMDKLVLGKNDVFLQAGVEYLKPSATDRINGAAAALGKLERRGWDVLFRHLEDRRPSTACRQTAGPHQVAEQCYHILRTQIVSYPQGYPDTRFFSADEDLDQLFKPSMKSWLLKRRDKSLDEIRIETLDYVIGSEKSRTDDVARSKEVVANLQRHREELRLRVSRSSKSDK